MDCKVGHFTSESIDKIIEVSTLEILLCQIGFALISKGPFNKFIFLSWWYQEKTFWNFEISVINYRIICWERRKSPWNESKRVKAKCSR